MILLVHAYIDSKLLILLSWSGRSDRGMTKRTEPYPTKPISRQEAIEQGKFFYLTGKPCKRGHLAPRKVSTCTCVECANGYTNADYHNNKAKHRERNKNWYHSHPERWKEMNKADYEKHKVGRLRLSTEYAAHIKEEQPEKYKEWNRNRNKRYAERHPAIRRAINYKRQKAIENATPLFADLKRMDVVL